MSFLLVAQRGLTVPGWVKNALWRAAKATPSLDLPFADSKSLVDAITGRQLISFARAGSGTYTDSAGVLSTAVTNLLLRSEEFNDASWTGSESNTTVTANTSTAPNGTVTADTIDFTNASSFRYQIVSGTPAGTTYTFSVWLASGIKTQTVIRIAGTSTGSGGQLVVSLTPTLTRYSVTVTIPSGNTAAFVGFENRTAVGGGDGSTGTIIAWGAQLEQSSTVGEYIPTGSTINSAPRFDHRITSTTTNLATRSEEFDNATWVQTGLNAFGSGSVANAIAAPDGTVTGDLIEEDTSTGFHRVSQTLISGTISTGTYTLAVYVKAAQRSRAYISLDDNATGEVTAGFALLTQNFNITTAGSWSGSTASIEDVGNGWFRISLTSTKGDGSSALTLHVGIAQININTISYPGSGTAGLYVWGAQLVASDSNGQYVRTTAAAASFSTTESLGLLVEEQRTNLLVRSEEFETTWTRTNISGFGSGSLVNAETAPNGTLTADLIAVANGINSGSGFISQDITKAATATTYTVTAFAKAQNWNAVTLHAQDVATNNNRATVTFSLATGVITTAATAFGTFSAASAITATPFINGWFRVNLTFTSSTETGLRVRLIPNNSTTVTSDGTNGIYLWGAQLEAGATATSYIPTTTAAATRNADVAQITGTNFSSWYNQPAGSVYAEFSPAFQGSASAPGNNPGVWGVTQNSLGSFNGYGIRLVPSSQFTDNINGVSRYAPGAFNNQVSIGLGAYLNTGQNYKTMFAWEPSGIAGSSQGQTAITNTNPAAAAMGTHDQFYLGRQNVGGTPTQLNGHIRRLVYWGQRLPNNVLQAITQ